MSNKNWMLTSVAVGCLLAANGAYAQTQPTATRVSEMGTIDPFYGEINPFYGEINPFYGSINPFYGSINPFYGSINPFYGSIDPFYGDINPFYGDINPFYGDISPFWGDTSAYWTAANPFSTATDPFYGNVSPFWGNITPTPLWTASQSYWQSAGPAWGTITQNWNALQAANATDYSSLQAQLQSFLSMSASFWGATVQNNTNKDFMDGFATSMLANYGINVDDPTSLANATAQTRDAFFLAWYDQLMNLTGTGHVDWWMGATNWTPELTQIQGPGGRYIQVGLLDTQPATPDPTVQFFNFVGGYDYFVNVHGTATSSLIAASDNGPGIMGIAPNSIVEDYNPFDYTGTASWDDVHTGLLALAATGAHVINMSLGVPGTVVSPEWASILTDPALQAANIVFVKAAGNEGAVQTTDVPWVGNSAPNNLILVGSVGPTGMISSFSNTPGTACFLTNNVCAQQTDQLMYHFIVAPGENILVSDGNGGVMRMSGTSFAAPLVTGAIALLYTRWPWLQQYPAETTQIIFQSATPLGTGGVNSTYGWGELNIGASQSPLNFNNLVVYQPTSYNGGAATTQTAWTTQNLQAAVLSPGQLGLWQQQNAFLTAFEPIGGTYRDFTIPLSSALVNQNQTSNGVNNMFQSYLYQRLINWANASTTSNFGSQITPFFEGDWHFSVAATPYAPEELTHIGENPFHTEFAAYNQEKGFGVQLGQGNGAHALMGDSGFTLVSDFSPTTGGVNPILGLASGGAYARGVFDIGSNAKLSMGYTQNKDDHTFSSPTVGQVQLVPVPASTASASLVGMDYVVAEGVTMSASYTRLNEANGLLGAEGSGPLSFSGGTQSSAATLGATAALGDGWGLSASATSANTPSTLNGRSALAVSKDGLQSTAYELLVTKTDLFADLDQLRFSLTQPLHVDSGSLTYRYVGVVNRSTGQLGLLSQTWDLSSAREYRAEAVYALPVINNHAEIDGFTMLDMNPPETPDVPLTLSVGARFRWAI